MVKSRFSSLDLRAMVTSLQQSVPGYRVSNVYDLSPKTYVLKLAKPDSKLLLLIEAGVRMHTTAYARDKELVPSAFTVKLRKHLRTRRVEKIEMLGADRLVVLTCGSGPAERKLILEMYDKGNIILTDADCTILTLLRNSKHDADARVTVNDRYPLVVMRELPPPDKAWLVQQLQEAYPSSTMKQILMRLLPLGKEVTDHCLAAAHISPSTKLSTEPWKDEGLILNLLDAIIETTRYFHEAEAAPPAGIIVLKQSEGSETGCGGDGGGGAADSVAGNSNMGIARMYDEFAPFEMLQHRGKQLLRFEHFSEAVDEFFSKLEARRAVDAVEAQQNAAWKKVDKIRSAQEGRLEILRSKEEEGVAKAQLIEACVEDVDALLNLLRGGVESGMDWEELTRLVIESKRQGDPLASMVHSLDLLHNAVEVVLSTEEDDADEEAITAPATLVRLDVRLTAFANARAFYTEKKAAAVKNQKTIQAAQAAVRAAEKKAAKTVQSIKVSAAIKEIRQPFWFEKFDWFVTSENILVVSARDAQQAELLVRRHLKPGDLYVHADVDGAPVTVVKAARGVKAPLAERPVSLAQAGSCVICRSNGWTSKVVTSAWWVLDSQISKTDHTGFYLPTGRFHIQGQRHYLPPNQLVMGLGVLFRVSHRSIAAHFGDRRRTAGASAGDEGGAEAEPEEPMEDERVENVEGSPEGEDGVERDGEESQTDNEDACNPTTKVGMSNGGATEEDDEAEPLDEEDGEVERAGEEAVDMEAEVEAEGELVRKTAMISTGSMLRMGTDGTFRIVTFDKLQGDATAALSSGEPRSSDGGEGGEGTLQGRGHKTAKERRQARKARGCGGAEAGSGTGVSDDTVSERSFMGAGGDGDSVSDTASVQSSMAGGGKLKGTPALPPTRGKHGKAKKIKDKYAERDDEDKQLHLQLLRSAGQSKRELEKERIRLELEEKKQREREREQKKAANVKRQQDRENEQRARRQAQAEQAEHRETVADGPDEEDGEDFEAFGELAALLEQEEVKELGELASSQLCAQDTLVSMPVEGDELLHAVAVCAPYAVMAGYKFKVKLTPGSQKKGKAAKQAVALFTSSATSRERELIQAMPIDETVRVVLPNVKIASAGRAVAAMTRSEKTERRMAATQRKQGKNVDVD